jgi:hypothetical protein
MKIIIDRTNEERQSAIVTIDTKHCTYRYAIKDALELALKLDGHTQSVIDDVFGHQTHEFKSETK